MPPALSDDDMSDGASFGSATPPRTAPSSAKRAKKGSSEDISDISNSNSRRSSQAAVTPAPAAAHANGSAKRSAKAKSYVEPEPVEPASDKDDDGDDDDGEEEEYEVQSILEHLLDEQGKPRFRVQWKGYDDPSDYTWEPEDNLIENASEILEEYISRIGGRAKLFEKPSKGKKRGRPAAAAPTSAAATATVAKRTKKNGADHPAERETPPPPPVEKVFKLPSGSWDSGVEEVEMYRNVDGELIVCLSWKGGHKTQHPARQAYLRCPQKILQFYESHISFKSETEQAEQ